MFPPGGGWYSDIGRWISSTACYALLHRFIKFLTVSFVAFDLLVYQFRKQKSQNPFPEVDFSVQISNVESNKAGEGEMNLTSLIISELNRLLCYQLIRVHLCFKAIEQLQDDCEVARACVD